MIGTVTWRTQTGVMIWSSDLKLLPPHPSGSSTQYSPLTLRECKSDTMFDRTAGKTGHTATYEDKHETATLSKYSQLGRVNSQHRMRE